METAPDGSMQLWLVMQLLRGSTLEAVLDRADYTAAPPRPASASAIELVLYDVADLGVRLRLHVYQAGFFDRPHNHRWSFASHILRGGYTHRIFGRDDQFGEDTDPDSLLPIHERLEQPGSAYALHHTSVHTVQAEADTISLLVRGPSAKQRFLILDAAAGGFFWVYGAAQESPEQRASKRLTPDQLTNTITRIQRLIADLDPASRSATLDGR
ncbi:MAG: hypothetical protein ACRDSF_18665 [Pseudonocardiaceae bacterium]